MIARSTAAVMVADKVSDTPPGHEIMAAVSQFSKDIELFDRLGHSDIATHLPFLQLLVLEVGREGTG